MQGDSEFWSRIAAYFYSLLCKQKHDKFEKFIVSAKLNAYPVYVDDRHHRESQ